MKKGFTLIELLAVIVILAIISLIATPVILNIIGDTKILAKQRSVDLFEKNILTVIVNQNQKDLQFNYEGIYKTTDGKTLINKEDNTKTITLFYDGDIVICDKIKITKEGEVSTKECIVGNDPDIIINPKDDLVPTKEQFEKVLSPVLKDGNNMYYFVEKYDVSGVDYFLAYVENSEENAKAVFMVSGTGLFQWFCDQKSADVGSDDIPGAKPKTWYVFNMSIPGFEEYTGPNPFYENSYDPTKIKDQSYMNRVIASFDE